MQIPEDPKNFYYKSVIWDWNGTLLDDLDLCVSTINILLSERNLPLLSNGKYREVFSFPVKNYYKKAGFDFSKENFEILAKEYIEKYNEQVNKCHLHPAVKSVLEKLRTKGKRQFVLSAMKQDMLKYTIQFHGISEYFEKITGLDDHYAVSKIEQGKKLLKEAVLKKNETCIIGDTLHDFEVAKELGVDCILIADGHQSKERLLKSKATVFDSLNKLSEYIN